MYDFAVIGGGIVGGLIARELTRYTSNLCLVERENDVAKGATRANSAIVHAGFDAAEGSLKAKLNVRGSALMEGVCAELGVKYRRNGSLVIGFSEEDRATLECLYARGVSNGVRELALLDQAALRALEPRISERATCALHAPTGAIVCPYELCIAAIGNAMDNGAALLCDFTVSAVTHAQDRIILTAADGRVVEAATVINAAGLHADTIARLAGDASFSIHPRRGEYILLDRTAGGTVTHTVFRVPSRMGKGILVTPTVDGNLLVGPTSVDTEDKEDTATTAAGLSRIMKEATENIAGGVAFGQSITSFCGLRAVGSTGDFIIREHNGMIHVAGIESPGLSSAPAIAEYVIELLRKSGKQLIPRTDFDPVRPPKHHFREASANEKNTLIAREPAYGRIVCRCEAITEGEILDAIRSNPPAVDVDGVKRRTRAGMGRCQGGFCGPAVMELIARERGIPPEAVTKSGGRSRLVYGKTK